jgi:hypothetical protein
MKIKMDFICNQDWNNLKDVDCGKYCIQCDEIIIDLTSSSKNQIVKELELNKDLCGLYNIEQVDNDIIAPVKTMFTSSLFVSLTSLFLLFNPKITLSQTNTPNKVEKVEQNSKSTMLDSNQVIVKNKQSDDSVDSCTKTKAKKNNHRQLYFTKRIPFIVFRRRTMMGKSIRTL